MANTTPLRYETGFRMRVDQAFLKDLDDLRALERPLLTRADLIRKLVAKAKKQKAKKRGR